MPVLLIPILFVAGLAILSAEFGWQALFHATKPLTTLLILLQAAIAVPVDSAGRSYLLAALALALAGDIVLMLPRGWFRAGLLIFLTAHLALIGAFATRLPKLPPPGPLLVFLGLAALPCYFLRRSLGSDAGPVFVYASVLAVMTWTAWGVWTASPSGVSGLALVGAVLFLASDVTLAFRRYRGAFRGGQVLTLGPYYAALIFISLSFAGKPLA